VRANVTVVTCASSGPPVQPPRPVLVRNTKLAACTSSSTDGTGAHSRVAYASTASPRGPRSASPKLPVALCRITCPTVAIGTRGSTK
jgi:hypothetical protein